MAVLRSPDSAMHQNQQLVGFVCPVGKLDVDVRGDGERRRRQHCAGAHLDAATARRRRWLARRWRDRVPALRAGKARGAEAAASAAAAPRSHRAHNPGRLRRGGRTLPRCRRPRASRRRRPSPAGWVVRGCVSAWRWSQACRDCLYVFTPRRIIIRQQHNIGTLQEGGVCSVSISWRRRRSRLRRNPSRGSGRLSSRPRRCRSFGRRRLPSAGRGADRGSPARRC